LFLEEYNFSVFVFHEGVCTFLDLDHHVVEAIEYNTFEYPDDYMLVDFMKCLIHHDHEV
jgi:hypothetical protein